MKTVLVDMDDTIENCTEAWVNYVNRRFGTDVKPESLRDWDVSKAFPTLTREQVYGVTFEEAFWLTVKPIDGAAEYMKKLIDDGNKIYIVSCAAYETMRVKMEDVLFKYFPFIEWNEIIVTYNKKIINADVMIDDGVHNLIGADCVRILMDAPYNRDFNEEAYGMFRVRNWKEIYDLINSGKLEACDVHGVGVYKGKKKIRNDLFGEINE